jgi:hypothetical protein
MANDQHDSETVTGDDPIQDLADALNENWPYLMCDGFQRTIAEFILTEHLATQAAAASKAQELVAEWEQTSTAALADLPTAVKTWMKHAAEVLQEVSSLA